MADYKINAPDGFAYKLTVPDDATPDQINEAAAVVANHHQTQQSYIAGLARTGLGQGTAFGFGDEIAAGARHFVGGEDYDKALADERAKVKAFETEHPYVSTAAEIAGGALTPGVGLAGDVIRPAATVLGRVGQGMALGGGLGSIAGFGAGEGGLGNRLQGAKQGAEFGAALGGTIPVAGAVAGGAIQGVRDMASPTLARLRGGIGNAADEVLSNRFRRAGIDPTNVASDLQAGQDATKFKGSNAMLPEGIVDTSPAMQKLGGSVYRAGNEANEIGKDFLASRQGGNPEQGLFGKPKKTDEPGNQYERLIDTFRRAFSVKSKDFDKQAAAIKNEQAVLGNESYKRAFDTQDNFDAPLSDTITAWELKRRTEPGKPEQQALGQALKLFERPADFMSNNKVPFAIDRLERFDAAKRSLDGMIGDTQNNNVKRLLVQFKNDTLDAIHGGDRSSPTLNTAYSDARNEWGSRAELLDALKNGHDYMLGNGDVSAQDFKQLTKPEQAMFRLGATKGLEKILGGKAIGPTADFTQALRKPNVYQRLRDITPQGQTSGNLNELVNREARMSESGQKVMGGSQTAERGTEDMELNGRDILGAAVQKFRSSPGLVNLGLDFISAGAEKAFGFRDDMAKALAQRLFNADPAAQQAILARVSQRMGKEKTSKFLAFMSKASLAGTTGLAQEGSRDLAPQGLVGRQTMGPASNYDPYQ